VDGEERVTFALCPQLARMSLFSCRRWTGEDEDEDEDEEADEDEEQRNNGLRPMVDLLSCRWNVPASRRSLRVATINWLPSEAAPELHTMSSEGLDLTSLTLDG